VDVIVFELTLVLALVAPEELPLSMFLSILVLPFVTRAIGPDLHALPVLLVVLPVALVLRPISMDINPLSVSLVVKPLPLVGVTVRMNEPTFEVGRIVFPEALKFAPVRPDLFPLALSEAFLAPLSDVDRSVFQHVGAPLGEPLELGPRLDGWVVNIWTKFLLSGLHLLVALDRRLFHLESRGSNLRYLFLLAQALDLRLVLKSDCIAPVPGLQPDDMPRVLLVGLQQLAQLDFGGLLGDLVEVEPVLPVGAASAAVYSSHDYE